MTCLLHDEVVSQLTCLHYWQKYALESGKVFWKRTNLIKSMQTSYNTSIVKSNEGKNQRYSFFSFSSLKALHASFTSTHFDRNNCNIFEKSKRAYSLNEKKESELKVILSWKDSKLGEKRV
jgi:hypothetical protein